MRFRFTIRDLLWLTVVVALAEITNHLWGFGALFEAVLKK